MKQDKDINGIFISKPVCCGKEMYYRDGLQSMIHSNEAEIQSWVCLECGRYITLIEDYMNDEELDVVKEEKEDF